MGLLNFSDHANVTSPPQDMMFKVHGLRTAHYVGIPPKKVFQKLFSILTKQTMFVRMYYRTVHIQTARWLTSTISF